MVEDRLADNDIAQSVEDMSIDIVVQGRESGQGGTGHNVTEVRG